MIIPIRCFSCNKPIAHLWDQYLDDVSKYYANNVDKKNNNIIIKSNVEDYIKNNEESIEKKTLDKLNMKRYCCRRMFLTHVDLCKKI